MRALAVVFQLICQYTIVLMCDSLHVTNLTSDAAVHTDASFKTLLEASHLCSVHSRDSGDS